MTPLSHPQRIASVVVMVLGSLVILGTDDEGPTKLERDETVHFDAGETALDFDLQVSEPYRLKISVDSGARLAWTNEPASVPEWCVTRSKSSLTFECARTYNAETDCSTFCEGVVVTVSRKDSSIAEDVSMSITLESIWDELLEIEVTPD